MIAEISRWPVAYEPRFSCLHSGHETDNPDTHRHQVARRQGTGKCGVDVGVLAEIAKHPPRRCRLLDAVGPVNKGALRGTISLCGLEKPGERIQLGISMMDWCAVFVIEHPSIFTITDSLDV